MCSATSALLLLSGCTEATEQEAQLVLKGEGKQIVIGIDIADEPEEREKGLMGRTDLQQGEGMLFTWQEPVEVQMWMKDTSLSLDMLFVRDGEVLGVISHTTPYSEKLLGIGQPIDAVLEVLAGEAERLGIRTGWQIELKN
ncbi:MAG: DUF192 domain-containing protein [Alphaproteobacteria bacterium]|nr:DUF192 domain-containing protein [Alphaproteobacteria bacterium]MDD9919655.1 DUF192 domain-containing protein [Alphaproteobacteria bacterium]